MKTRRLLGGILIAISILTSCGENSNPIKVVERDLTDFCLEEYGDYYELVSFEKTNGKKGEINGIEVYEIEYKAVFETTEELLLKIETISKYDREKLIGATKREIQVEMYYLSNPLELTISNPDTLGGFVIGRRNDAKEYEGSSLYRRIPAKTKIERTGKKTLIKTDNGWEVD